MRTYDYACDCGARFEAMVADVEKTPSCPACGGQTRRLPAAGAALLGRARLPATAAKAPKSWEGTYRGNTEYIAHWRRELDARAELEARHPELAEPRYPVVAHEGRYHSAPLTTEHLAGGAAHQPHSESVPPIHQHPHPHGHPHTRPHVDSRPNPEIRSSGRPAD